MREENNSVRDLLKGLDGKVSTLNTQVASHDAIITTRIVSGIKSIHYMCEGPEPKSSTYVRKWWSMRKRLSAVWGLPRRRWKLTEQA
eukprot:2078728-Amphidinium_carterae.1